MTVIVGGAEAQAGLELLQLVLMLGDVLADLAVGIVQIAEEDGLVGANLAAAGDLLTGVQHMGAHGALHGQLLLLVPEDGAVGAGLEHIPVALGLLRVDDDDAVGPLVDLIGVLAHALGVGALLADGVDVVHLDLAAGAVLDLVELHQVAALAGGRADGAVIVSGVLVLAGEEAGIAAVAALDIKYKTVSHGFIHSFYSV